MRKQILPLYELMAFSRDLVPGDCRRGETSHHAVEHDPVTRCAGVVGWGGDPAWGHYSMVQVRQELGEDIYH